MVPICIGLAFLPGPGWLRRGPGFALVASVGTVVISADDIRAWRLHQHDLPVPNDPDIGRPAHSRPSALWPTPPIDSHLWATPPIRKAYR